MSTKTDGRAGRWRRRRRGWPRRASGWRRSRGAGARCRPGASRRWAAPRPSARRAAPRVVVPRGRRPASRLTCHSASRAKLRPQVRTSAACESGVRMPREISSLVRSSASRSASVNATSSSPACGKPSCCQSSSATSRGTPARSATCGRVYAGSGAEQRPVDVLDQVERAPRRSLARASAPRRSWAVRSSASRKAGTSSQSSPDGVAGEVQHLELGQADDRGGAERVVDDRGLAHDVAGPEPGDLARRRGGPTPRRRAGCRPCRPGVFSQIGDQSAGRVTKVPAFLIRSTSSSVNPSKMGMYTSRSRRFSPPCADPRRPLRGCPASVIRPAARRS